MSPKLISVAPTQFLLLILEHIQLLLGIPHFPSFFRYSRDQSAPPAVESVRGDRGFGPEKGTGGTGKGQGRDRRRRGARDGEGIGTGKGWEQSVVGKDDERVEAGQLNKSYKIQIKPNYMRNKEETYLIMHNFIFGQESHPVAGKKALITGTGTGFGTDRHFVIPGFRSQMLGCRRTAQIPKIPAQLGLWPVASRMCLCASPIGIGVVIVIVSRLPSYNRGPDPGGERGINDDGRACVYYTLRQHNDGLVAGPCR